MAVDPKADETTRADVPRGARAAVAGAGAATRSIFEQPDKRHGRADALFRAVLLLGLMIALLAMASIVAWTIVRGMPRVEMGLFTNNPSTVDPSRSGFRTAILGSIMVISGVIVMIVPLGVGTAIYLEQYANPTRWFNRVIDLNIQNLAGVPSIVFGILGLGFIARGPLQLGFTPVTGMLTLSLLVLPTIILASREAIRAVPSSIQDGSMALGATRLQTIRHQVVPAARPGILTGLILSVARATGEAAPLLLIGAVTFVTFDPSPFDPGFTTLPVMIYQYYTRPQEAFRVLAVAGAIVMLLIVLLMNSVAVYLRYRYEKKLTAG
jgi:phosphate transport system permease protein